MPRPRKSRKRRSQKVDLTTELQPINRHAAGIDVGSAEHYVAVPVGRDPHPVQTFGSFTADLHRLAQWLKTCQIETVVMQATGVYWIGLYEVLETYGLQVYVVNAHHTKTLPGRKTDVQECQWLQKLHTFGLLNNSFRPPEPIRALRCYLRSLQLAHFAPSQSTAGGRIATARALETMAITADLKARAVSEVAAWIRSAPPRTQP
jgi:transposase